MCGIYCAVSKRGHVPPSDLLKGLLLARGPDVAKHLFLPHDPVDSKVSLTLFSTVLALRGSTPAAQPLQQSRCESALCWNGEAWAIDGKEVCGNDTEAVFNLIYDATAGSDTRASGSVRDCSAFEAVRRALARISGPYAFVFYDSVNLRLYFGRDILGRRSLLYAINADGDLVFASVADANSNTVWKEIEGDGTYCLDLKPSVSASSIEIECWGDFGIMKGPYIQNEESATIGMRLTAQFAICRAARTSGILCTTSPSVSELERLLHDSLRMRLQNIPDTRADSCEASEVIDDADHACRVAILFSGGLDCSVLARMAHEILPEDEGIDLLNVAFENPRIHKDAGSKAYELCPDRITARKSYAELRTVCPSRKWRFIAIDIPYAESQRHRQTVINLMLPHNTEMDLSIALALYFAARGAGYTSVPDGRSCIQYTTSARILLSGLGADELFAGYIRHATAFKREGFQALLDELELDMNRLGKRNLGRDDRVISHWGREVRFPYLDENVVQWALAVPYSDKCGFGEVRDGIAEDTDESALLESGKKVLRCLAWKLGMHGTAREPKRAIQFGSRTAKMDTGNTKGTQQLS